MEGYCLSSLYAILRANDGYRWRYCVGGSVAVQNGGRPMKIKTLVLAGLLIMCMSGQAEAAWHDVVIVKQVKNIGLCILADAGKIGTSVVKHTSELIGEVVTSIKDCLVYVVDEVTPDDEPTS